MIERGIPQNTIDTLQNAGISLYRWLNGFDNVVDSVRHTVQMVKNHPLLPSDVPVHGLVINPEIRGAGPYCKWLRPPPD